MNNKNIPPFKYILSKTEKYGKKQLAVETVAAFNGISISSEYNQDFNNLFYHFNIQNMQTAAFYDSNFTKDITIDSDFKFYSRNGNIIILFCHALVHNNRRFHQQVGQRFEDFLQHHNDRSRHTTERQRVVCRIDFGHNLTKEQEQEGE